MTFPQPTYSPLVPTSLAVVHSASGTDDTIEIPAAGGGSPGSVAVGDLAIVWNKAENGAGSVSNVLPSGWESFVANNSGSGPGLGSAIFAKKLASGDLNTALTGMNSSAEAWALLIVHPNNPLTTFAAITSFQVEATSGNPSSQAIPVASTPLSWPAVALALYNTAFATLNPRTDDGSMTELNLDGASAYAKYKLFATGAARSNINVDMDDEGGMNCLASGALVIT